MARGTPPHGGTPRQWPKPGDIFVMACLDCGYVVIVSYDEYLTWVCPRCSGGAGA